VTGAGTSLYTVCMFNLKQRSYVHHLLCWMHCVSVYLIIVTCLSADK
jgi:hypothetical protein